MGVHDLCSVLLSTYALCVDIAVTYFAKVNVGEHLWNHWVPETLQFVY